MFVAPVIVHLSRLVTDRGKRPEVAGEGAGKTKAPADGEDTKVLYGTEAHVELQADEAEDGLGLEEITTTKEKRTPSRKPIRIHRVRQTKAKAKKQSKSSSPITGSNVKCRSPFSSC
jgi:hypothetical protein